MEYFIAMDIIGRANIYGLISVPYETYRNALSFGKLGVTGGESKAGVLGVNGIDS
jgi:hypothetical protein